MVWTTRQQLDNMVSKEIREEVYEFIKSNPNRTKRQVVLGMKKVCSRLTVLEAIDKLMSENSDLPGRVEYSRNTPRGPYHLYVNDKNEFNKILDEVTWLVKASKNIADAVQKDLPKMKKGQTKFLDKHYPNLVNLGQVTIYLHLTRLVSLIERKVKSIEERELLYHHLPTILLQAEKLHRILIPEIAQNAMRMMEELEKSTIVKGRSNANLIDAVADAGNFLMERLEKSKI